MSKSRKRCRSDLDESPNGDENRNGNELEWFTTGIESHSHGGDDDGDSDVEIEDYEMDNSCRIEKNENAVHNGPATRHDEESEDEKEKEKEEEEQKKKEKESRQRVRYNGVDYSDEGDDVYRHHHHNEEWLNASHLSSLERLHAIQQITLQNQARRLLLNQRMFSTIQQETNGEESSTKRKGLVDAENETTTKREEEKQLKVKDDDDDDDEKEREDENEQIQNEKLYSPVNSFLKQIHLERVHRGKAHFTYNSSHLNLNLATRFDANSNPNSNDHSNSNSNITNGVD